MFKVGADQHSGKRLEQKGVDVPDRNDATRRAMSSEMKKIVWMLLPEAFDRRGLEWRVGGVFEEGNVVWRADADQMLHLRSWMSTCAGADASDRNASSDDLCQRKVCWRFGLQAGIGYSAFVADGEKKVGGIEFVYKGITDNSLDADAFPQTLAGLDFG